MNRYKKPTLADPNMESTKPSILHSEELSIPVFPGQSALDCYEVEILDG